MTAKKKTTAKASKKLTAAATPVVPRGLTARWHCNQAMRLACLTLADKLDTPCTELPGFYAWKDANTAKRAIDALSPLVFGMEGPAAPFIEDSEL